MLDKQKTKEIVTSFYYECYKFWERQGKDVHEAKILALVDCASLKHDPRIPRGEELDPNAKVECLEKLKVLERIGQISRETKMEYAWFLCM